MSVNDLDLVLPRQRRAPEPHAIAERRNRRRRRADWLRLLAGLLALLASVAVFALVGAAWWMS